MRRLALLVSIAALSACSAAPGPQPVNQGSGVQTPAHPAGTPSGPVSGTQTPAGGARPGKPGEPAADDAKAKELDDKVATLEAAYAKNQSDAAAKKALADATLDDADYYMSNGQKGPGVYYPRALKLYRRVAQLDPTNDRAKAAAQQIEDIYRSMNRPVPDV